MFSEIDARWAYRHSVTADTYFPTHCFCRFGLVGHRWAAAGGPKRFGLLFPCFESCRYRKLASITGLGEDS